MNRAWSNAINEACADMQAGQNSGGSIEAVLYAHGVYTICPFCGCDKVGYHGAGCATCPVCGNYEIMVHRRAGREEADIKVRQITEENIDIGICWATGVGQCSN